MILEKLNCEYLKLSPFSYENGYNTGTLKALQITGKVNDGELITKNIDLTVARNRWVVEFTGAQGITVKQIYVKNIFTGQIFPLLVSQPVQLTNSNLQNIIVPRVNTVLHSTLNCPTATVTASLIGATGNITIDNLPYNLVMEKVTLSLLGIEQDSYFTFLTSPDVVINNNTILLKPSFFGLESFIDGIYSMTTIVTTTDNVLIEEQACFFWDCEMAGKLQLYTDGTECDPHKMHLLLMHYTLTQSSNNACNCENMYDIFSYLALSLNNVTNEDCGCK